MKIAKVTGVTTGYKVGNLKKEIAELEEKVKTSKDKYGNLSEEMIAVSCKVCLIWSYNNTIYQFNVKDSFVLDPETAQHVLSIELDIPIEIIALRSSIPLDIVECDTPGVVISTCAVDVKQDGSLFKATLRCSETTKRIRALVCFIHFVTC